MRSKLAVLVVAGAVATIAGCRMESVVVEHRVVPERQAEVVDVPPAWGEDVWDVEVFYDQLEPYGSWIEIDGYGVAWEPSVADYVPYSSGYWIYTEYGFTWISEESFAWAVYHYGYWIWYEERWVWLPGTVWAPAWVDWREHDEYIAWSPASPDDDYWEPPPRWSWHCVPLKDLFQRDLRPFYQSITIVEQVTVRGRPIVRFGRNPKGHRWAMGPSPDRLRASGVDLRPLPLPARDVGRIDPPRRVDLDRRLHDRRQRDPDHRALLERARSARERAREHGHDRGGDRGRVRDDDRQRRDHERERRDREARERAERERAERERAERERAERERAERERTERERTEREREARERDRERVERESRGRAEKERLERERLENARREKERLEQERQRSAEEERRQRAEEERRQRTEAERRQREEQERKRAEAERRQREEQERARRADEERRQRAEAERRQREEQERAQREEAERRQREEQERRERAEKERREREDRARQDGRR